MTTSGAAGKQEAKSGTTMGGAPRLKRLQGPDRLNELPEELLSTILGFMDVLTLCTARLVCKRFRQSAAMHVKALRLDWTTLEELPPTDFTQFSGLTHLAVNLADESHLQSLAHPRIAPVVTHVCLEDVHLQDRQTSKTLAASLMAFPKLRSLSLQPLWRSSCDIPLFPPGLDELRMTDRRPLNPLDDDNPGFERWRGVGDASALTRCSMLTSLAIDLLEGAEASLGSLSSLRHLRALELKSCPSAIRVLSTLTALTSLTFVQIYSGDDESTFQDIARLTRLSRLSLQAGNSSEALTYAQIACIAQLTQLTCLKLPSCWLPENLPADSSALAPLTRLVSFSVQEARGPRLVSGLRVEALQSLTLDGAEGAEFEDVSFLRRATRLTHLHLCGWWDEELSGVGNAIARITGLRSLTFRVTFRELGDDEESAAFFRLDRVLRACTKLTKLDYSWEIWPDRDFRACASLPGLRSLSFRGDNGLTPAIFPTLQAMSGLTELCLFDTGIRVADMTPEVIAAFNARRLRMGWPLLKFQVESCSWDGRLERIEQ